jgi:uncharacterized protein (TIGR02680 family)
VTTLSDTERFRFTRGGILNVWQYDDQVFTFAGGRLLLRGANGAGKSKTLEMLLPFVLDGDKARMTASGRHHTSLLWLMTDGYSGSSRTGYLWVEFTRPGEDGELVTMTCGVGIRASDTARTATAWFFTSPRRVGEDLLLEDESGPLSAARCRAEVEQDGHFFDSARRYRDHVGQVLFGLPPDQYDELLRLLYWLRQPQVGEDIEPRRLADQLVQALPQVDDEAVRAAGDTFDELEAFGEQIDRRDRAATAVADFAGVYRSYAREVLRERAGTVVAADREVRRCRTALGRSERALEQTESALASGREQLAEVSRAQDSARGRIGELEKGPEARAQQRLTDLANRVSDLAAAAERAAEVATAASGRARASAERAERARKSTADTATRLHDDLTETGRQLGEVGAFAPLVGAAELFSAGGARGWSAAAAVPVAAGASVDGGPGADRAGAVEESSGGARSEVTERIAERRSELGALRATVVVVEAARVELEEAHQAASAAETLAAGVEQRAERASAELALNRQRSAEAEDLLNRELEQWQAAAHAVPLDLPELNVDGLAALESSARESAAPVRAGYESAAGEAQAAVRAADRRRSALQVRRRAVEAEVDPSPPAPTWVRSERSGLAGAPFWRLVDFRDGLPEAERAGLEAALGGSGLLDAWVHPDGRVEDPHRHDLLLAVPESGLAGLLAAPPRGPAGSLAGVLVADVPDGSGVSAALVTAVLDSIGLGDDESVTHGHLDVRVAADGTWAAGPMRGRAAKESAQYIGATARAAERQRRLATIDAELGTLADELVVAERARDEARSAIRDLDQWLAARPRHEEVLRCWAALTSAESAAEQVTAELARAQEAAVAARSRAANRRDRLESLASEHGLPTSADGLAARQQQLSALTTRLDRHDDALRLLGEQVADWSERWQQAADDERESRSRGRDAEAVSAQAEQVRAEHDELRSAMGDSVQQLERRLASLRQELTESIRRQNQLQEEVESLRESLGTGRTQVQVARDDLDRAGPQLETARSALAALATAPGLVVAAADLPEETDGEPGQAESAATSEVAAVGEAEVATARRLAELTQIGGGDANAVLKASQELQAGPAATLEPRVFELNGVLVALGREESGERPLVELATRLRRSVDADRELLTDRERRLFEDHVLGHLGDSLRGVRLKAEELVTAMNGLLSGVTTSQGIRVRLRWRLRDDLPAEARRAVELLGEPVGALLPDEKRDLRESLHRLIEVSRAEEPGDSYAEHLARALDYRQWFAFRIQYHRPEARDWLDLHRKSPLSQGEQKVLCYLPLFAAAAAHFTSVAGAAPHAPRFVLLDDAFPKIDIRTHPLLFGLLVDLDLDFVVTSERLWGDHATVPELAIYEALRSPTERGIAQYEHRWDGHQLTAVGA